MTQMLLNRLKHALSLLVIIVSLSSPTSFAAENRRPDNQSSSRVQLTLAILPTLSIETVSDVHFNIERRDVDANYEEFFCVRGTGDTRYSIIAYGSTSSGDMFQLTNSSGESLDYAVAYRGQAQSETFDALEPGKQSPVYEVLAQNETCDGQANFNIKFRAEDLEAANSGLYSGALTLIVAPV